MKFGMKKSKQLKSRDDDRSGNEISFDDSPRESRKGISPRVMCTSLAVAVTLGVGIFFSNVNLQTISPDFYNSTPVTETALG